MVKHTQTCIQNLTFRSAAPNDIPAMLEIENAAHIAPWSHQMFSDSLQQGHPIQLMLDSAELVGYSVVMRVLDQWELLNIVVSPAMQGRGLGRRCLEQLLSDARQQSINQVLLEVRESNQLAIALYLSVGFKKCGLRKDYYRTESGKENAVLMQLGIPAAS